MSRWPTCLRVVCALLAQVLWFEPALSAQNKETVWTKVSADGSTITLSWDKNHPWSADLSRGGATLVAKYHLLSRQETLEPLAVARAGSEERQLRFSLPDGLRGDPAGPVCLFFQTPGRRVLPIRKSDKNGADTSGFRYEPWEKAARQRSLARIAQNRVTSAELALSRADQNVRGQEAIAASRGWQSLDACSNIAAPNFTLGERPRQVVPPADQDEESRRLCVYRALDGNEIRLEEAKDRLGKRVAALNAARDADAIRELLPVYFGNAFQGIDTDPVSFMKSIVDALGNDNATVRARHDELLAFVGDLIAQGAKLRGYEPRLPNYSNRLGWPSSASESVFRLYAKEIARVLDVAWAVEGIEGNSKDLETVLGAALDAYSGCVGDAKKQFARNWESWTELRASASTRADSAKDFLVRECRTEMQKLDALRADRDRFVRQLADERGAAATAATIPPIAGRVATLNTSSCAPQ